MTETLLDGWWRDKETLERVVRQHGTLAAASRAVGGVTFQTLSKWWLAHGLPPLPQGSPTRAQTPANDDDVWLIELLRKHGDDATVEQLADAANCAPRVVRDTAARLGIAGFRVSEDEGRVVLQRVAPDSTNVHPGLFAGTDFRIGVVSDTHLCSNEEALDELHCAYDIFKREGITTVLHAGDIVTGRGIYRGQEAETKGERAGRSHAQVRRGAAQSDG